LIGEEAREEEDRVIVEGEGRSAVLEDRELLLLPKGNREGMFNEGIDDDAESLVMTPIPMLLPLPLLPLLVPCTL